jgi:hypothetical protein
MKSAKLVSGFLLGLTFLAVGAQSGDQGPASERY